MNPSIAPFFHLRRAAAACTLFLASSFALAAPGAHGPGGEHLDAPGPATASTSAVPRFEAQTETFELVGRLTGAELTLVIDRYENNQPVVDAQVEVESDALKAQAKFRPESGDYVVSDTPLIKRLAVAGEHAIVITVQAGQDADLLNGTLFVGARTQPAAGAAGHGHGHGPDDHHHEMERALFVIGGLVVVGAITVVVSRRRRHNQPAAAEVVQ